MDYRQLVLGNIKPATQRTIQRVRTSDSTNVLYVPLFSPVVWYFDFRHMPPRIVKMKKSVRITIERARHWYILWSASLQLLKQLRMTRSHFAACNSVYLNVF